MEIKIREIISISRVKYEKESIENKHNWMRKKS